MWNSEDLAIASLYKEICENDETIRKKDLAERFINVTHDLCKDKWTLLQILANINIVMGD